MNFCCGSINVQLYLPKIFKCWRNFSQYSADIATSNTLVNTQNPANVEIILVGIWSHGTPLHTLPGCQSMLCINTDVHTLINCMHVFDI